MRNFISFLLTSFCLISCKNQTASSSIPFSVKGIKTFVKLQPMGNIEEKYIRQVYLELKKVNPNVEIMPMIPVPDMAYNAARNRYKADSIIKILGKRAAENEVFIGITHKDISTAKGDIKDFGVMGLAYVPGKACVASIFRLKNKSNFFKVVLHELAHTTGLPHCPEKNCYLRDAKGGDPSEDEKEFCKNCNQYLVAKGWNL